MKKSKKVLFKWIGFPYNESKLSGSLSLKPKT